jgi:hypothetical protein
MILTFGMNNKKSNNFALLFLIKKKKNATLKKNWFLNTKTIIFFGPEYNGNRTS